MVCVCVFVCHSKQVVLCAGHKSLEDLLDYLYLFWPQRLGVWRRACTVCVAGGEVVGSDMFVSSSGNLSQQVSYTHGTAYDTQLESQM